MIKQMTAVPKQPARRYFIIDIENLLGGARYVTDEAVGFAELVLRRELGMHPDDQILIGVTAIHVMFPIHRVFPGKAQRIVCGPDGAELAILRALDPSHVAHRFDEVVIVSGDGMFASLAAQLAFHGARVIVAGHRAGMSARLRLAAHLTHYFVSTFDNMKAAA